MVTNNKKKKRETIKKIYQTQSRRRLNNRDLFFEAGGKNDLVFFRKTMGGGKYETEASLCLVHLLSIKWGFGIVQVFCCCRS